MDGWMGWLRTAAVPVEHPKHETCGDKSAESAVLTRAACTLHTQGEVNTHLARRERKEASQTRRASTGNSRDDSGSRRRRSGWRAEVLFAQPQPEAA